MKIVIISDIHITGSSDPFYKKLLTLIEREIKGGDTLVLAGDIFDFLVGEQPKMNQQYSEFFDLLRKKGSEGAKIEFIEGNHDFHLESTLTKIQNCRLSPSEVIVETGKNRVYIAHGDLVDKADYGYRLLRSVFRSPFIRFAAYALPEAVVSWIGEASSKTSRALRGKERIEYIRKIFKAFSERKLQEGFNAVVLGHCHDLHEFGNYMNVGHPKTHGTFVVYTDEAGLQRKPLNK